MGIFFSFGHAPGLTCHVNKDDDDDDGDDDGDANYARDEKNDDEDDKNEDIDTEDYESVHIENGHTKEYKRV